MARCQIAVFIGHLESKLHILHGFALMSVGHSEGSQESLTRHCHRLAYLQGDGCTHTSGFLAVLGVLVKVIHRGLEIVGSAKMSLLYGILITPFDDILIVCHLLLSVCRLLR